MKKNFNFITLVIIVSLVCIFTLVSCSAKTSNNDRPVNSAGGNEVSSPAAKEISFETELSSGYYTSGTDFPPGKYDIEAISGAGNVSSDNMFDGGINALMGTEETSEKTDIYEQKYSNIDLPEGTVLSIKNGVTIKISSDNASGEPLKTRVQPNTETISLGNGNFVSGDDFPAGVYDIVAVEGTGNVNSDNMLDGGINAMMGIPNSDLFKDMYEAAYKNISLPEGTTLKIDGVTVNLVPSK